MFRGITAVTLDAKGRMVMPTQYRKQIMEDANGQLVVTIDTDQRCLLLYPTPNWEQIQEKLDKLPSFNPATRRIQRLLIGHATDVEMDRQGRLLLPPLLRDYAGFDKVVMLVGQGKKFELWDKDQWTQLRDRWLSETLGESETGGEGGGSGGNKMTPELLNLSL